MITLEQALKHNRGIGPGFHMLRHLLALIILAHHCRVAVFHEDHPAYAKGEALTASAISHLTNLQLAVELSRPALYALVGMFFALSGFLVMGSALRNPGVNVFFLNRALRILPALTVEVTLSALILGPAVTSRPVAAYFSDPQFFHYFGNIIGQVTFRLPGVFLTNPWSGMVNANLWTLPAEFYCYFLMLAMMITGLIAYQKWLTTGIICALAAATLLGIHNHAHFSVRDDSTHFTVWFIVMMFFFGVLFFINARRLCLHPLLFFSAAAGYYVLMIFNLLGPVAGLLLTYCTVYIGMTKFPFFDKILKHDLSYGIYLYGFPLTQAVIYFMFPYMTGIHGFVRYLIILPLVVAATILFATFSWLCIEKPALGLRRMRWAFWPKPRSRPALPPSSGA